MANRKGIEYNPKWQGYIAVSGENEQILTTDSSGDEVNYLMR